MDVISQSLHLLFSESATWLPQLQRHLLLSVTALVVSIAIGVPAGALLTRRERWAFAVVNVANLGRTIPSLAMLALAYPFVGTGFAPSIIALVALGLPPVLLTTYTGVREVDTDVSDAAAGMGLTSMQRLTTAELPVAAPIILGGIRTSAVQIVASASLAALIGGGGLGEMIMAGLTNMRYDLLLTGALLVALLAAATEVGFVMFERHGLPIGIRMLSRTPARQGMAYAAGSGVGARRWQLILLAVAVGSAALVGAGSSAGGMVARIGMAGGVGDGGPLPQVSIGSKDFTEQLVLGELYAQALEAQGYPVERRLGLGATAVADAALQRGEIDMYPEYTGTALFAVLKDDMPAVGGGSDGPAPATGVGSLEHAVYQQVERGYHGRGMALLAETPFSNGNAIVVTRKVARRYGLTTISDLARVSAKVDFGAVPGFDVREDGLPLLEKRYGVRFHSVKSFDNGLKYKALSGGRIDAVYGFETDGQIARDDLVVLRDDKSVWPPYHAVPVVSAKAARTAGPAFAPTIDAVSRLLDTATMQQLNDAVDHDRREPAEVARQFLRKHGLAKRGARPTVRIGSKDFTEQFILAELYAQALEARGFPVERHAGLGATAVADGALRKGRIDIYPEYTGTSYTAVLKRPVRPGTSPEEVWGEVHDGYAKRGLEVLRPTPFSNGNAIVVTKATAKRLGLETLSDLARVSGKLRFGAVPGFDTREDGIPLLEREYDMHFGSVKSYENGLKYKALEAGKVDAAYGFETDGQIADSGLVVLRDDRAVWPAYQVAPIVSGAFAKTVGGDFAATLEHVDSLLDARTMQRLNAKVDQRHEEPADVAHAFLSKHGLLARAG